LVSKFEMHFLSHILFKWRNEKKSWIFFKRLHMQSKWTYQNSNNLKKKTFECDWLIASQNTILHKQNDLMIGFVNIIFYNEL
jgi:hypothetical protein